MVKTIVEIVLGLVVFLLRITFSAAFALIAGLTALVVNSVRTTPEQKLKAKASASWGGKTGLITCPRCSRANESDRTHCYHCGAALVSPTDAQSLSDVSRSVTGVISSAIEQSPFRRHPVLLLVALVLVFLVVFVVPSVQQQRYQTSSRNRTQMVAPPPSSTLKLDVYNYGVRTLGASNWRRGYLTLYVENVGTAPMYPQTFTISSGELATAEGKTYPVSLYRVYGNISKYQGHYMKPNSGFQESTLPASVTTHMMHALPPNMPILLRDTGGFNVGYFILSFDFATAATPTLITLNTSLGSLEFPLNAIPKTIPPPDTSKIVVSTFADLANQLNYRTDKAEIAFQGVCEKNKSYSRSFSIPYSITNLDVFDISSIQHEAKYAVYYPTGEFIEGTKDVGFEKLNPGKVREWDFIWASYLAEHEPDPLYLIVYTRDGDPVFYPGTCE